MTSVVGRVIGILPLNALVWAVALAGPALGQGAGQTIGAQDTSTAHRATTGAGQSAAQFGAIMGLVIDSLRGGPLTGAQISVEGVASQALTDSLGRFRIDSVPAGQYRIGIFHPLLDSLGLSIASPPLTVPAGKTIALAFATPSAPTIVRLTCGSAPADTAAGSGPSEVIGRVLDAETESPVAGALVSLSWTDMQASQATGVHRLQRVRDTTTGPSGEFRFCHLPGNLAGSARTVHVGADSSGVSRQYAMNGRLVGFLVLHLPSNDTAARPGAPVIASASNSSPPSPSPSGHGVLTGRVVRSDSGAPFVGAQVMVLGTGDTAVTGDSGQFTLRGLPSGSRTLEVRAFGWAPVLMPVEVSQRAPRQVTVPLATKAAVLKPVVVTATVNAALHTIGFDAREKSGVGHFLGPEDIAKRNTFEIADLLAGMPGLVRRYSANGNDYLAGTRTMGPCCGCVNYILDGMPYRELMLGDINSYLQPNQIAAVEVYQTSEQPPTFAYSPPALAPATAPPAGTMGAAGNGGTDCVKIIIWTKSRLGL
jgi:hypothetical protein